jgi:hypothetical protein
LRAASLGELEAKVKTHKIWILASLLGICLLSTGSVAADDSNGAEQRIAELNQVITPEYDEMEDITWYRHKDEDRINGFGFYIAEKDGQDLLRFYAGTRGGDWVQFDRIIILGTFNDEAKEPVRLEVGIDPTERVDLVTETATTAFRWGGDIVCNERVDFPVVGRIDLESFRNLATADNVRVRYAGAVTYREYEVKARLVRAITDVLDYWDLVIACKQSTN